MVRIASLLFSIIGTALTGIIMTGLLVVPGLVDAKPMLLLVAGVAGFVIAIPISLLVARAILAHGLMGKN
jgi:hypothetical protein